MQSSTKRILTGLLLYPSLMPAAVDAIPLTTQQPIMGTQNKPSLSLSVGAYRHGNTHNTSIEGLLPWRVHQQQLLFLQTAWQRHPQYHQFTLGLGQRYYPGKAWGWGYSLFYDNQVSQHQQRCSVGFEAWVALLKLSANHYWPISGWRPMAHAVTQRYRPARGFDVMLQSFLPTLPQWSASVQYTHYAGHDTLWDSSMRWQKNPRSWCFGLNYTPVPLITLAYHHQTGVKNASAHQIGLTFHYHFNRLLALQLDPSQVNTQQARQGYFINVVKRAPVIPLQLQQVQPQQTHARTGPLQPPVAPPVPPISAPATNEAEHQRLWDEVMRELKQRQNEAL